MKTLLVVVVTIVFLTTGGVQPVLAIGGPDDVVVIDSKPDGRGWLGVSIQDMTPRLAKSMEVDTREGALVNEVIDGSPADDAGIKDEDIIVELNGEPIIDADDLARRIRKLEPDSKASLVLVRGHERKSLDVSIGKSQHPMTFGFSHPRIPSAPRVHMFMNNNFLGIEVQDLGEQLAEFFGSPKNEGVLVTSVEKDGPAAKAGLKAGDVVLKVENQIIREEDDIRDEVEEYKKGDKIQIGILREKNRKTLTLEIEEDMEESWFRVPHSEFEFEFDHESFNHFDHELHWDKEGSHSDLEALRIRLKELGKQIKEWGQELKGQLKSFDWVRS